MMVLPRKRLALSAANGITLCGRPPPSENAGKDDRSSEEAGHGRPIYTLDELSRENGSLRTAVPVPEVRPSLCSFQNILSMSPGMGAVFEVIAQVAQTATTVLIEGETGTGKELVARAVHKTWLGRTGPFIALSCAAVPETLLESELFGHEAGAFTGAHGLRRGRFEMAQDGTLFLDEVGDMPLAVQCKLLRVLQERHFERVGGTRSIAVDVRVIAATNRPLKEMVRDGTFRADLFYRLNVVNVKLPPLRERSEDIPLLAIHFAKKFALPGVRPKLIAPLAMAILRAYPWPGNIRELENAIERACVCSRHDTIRECDLPPDLAFPTLEKRIRVNGAKSLPEALHEAAAAIEEQYIRAALKTAHGHVGHCARLCNMSRRSISTKLAKYRIQRSEYSTD